jgi:glycine/D-amino acid oxidase-like deaminating enzyme
LGPGVVGLATTVALLRRGVDVICFERTGAPMTERSAGSSRIFGLALHTARRSPNPRARKCWNLARVLDARH